MSISLTVKAEILGKRKREVKNMGRYWKGFGAIGGLLVQHVYGILC